MLENNGFFGKTMGFLNIVFDTTSHLIYLRIDCYFRAHMEYKRPDVGARK